MPLISDKRRGIVAKVLLSQRPSDTPQAPQFAVHPRRQIPSGILVQGYDHALASSEIPNDSLPVGDFIDDPAQITQFQQLFHSTFGLASGTPLAPDSTEVPLSTMPPALAQFFTAINLHHSPSPQWLVNPGKFDSPFPQVMQPDTTSPLQLSAAEPHAHPEQDLSFNEQGFLHSQYSLFEIAQETTLGISGATLAGILEFPWPGQTELSALEDNEPSVKVEDQELFQELDKLLEYSNIAGQVKLLKSPPNLLDIELQLNDLRHLTNGWAEGMQPAGDWGNDYGQELSNEGLDWLARRFNQFYARNLPRPHLFPTPLGGVQAEWLLEPHDASLEIDLESHSGEWHCLNLNTKAEIVRDLDLDQAESWAWLSSQILSLGPATE